MKEVSGDFILEEVAKTLDNVDCDYIFAIFPSGDASSSMASIGLNLNDNDRAAFFLSQLIMQGDALGWNILELLQKTCKQLPIPLHYLLAASQADYQELTTLHEESQKVMTGGKRKK